MLFGGAPATDTKESKRAQADSAIIEDDAIVVEEDDAIVVEDDAIVADEASNNNIDQLNALLGGAEDLTKEDKAIIKASKQKPLWQEEGRVKYTRQQLLDEYQKEDEINFALFDDDYMSMFEVFSQ